MQTQYKSNLFEATQLGALHVKNRVVMAPLTRARAGSHGIPTQLNAEYYAQRASAGLIISEATNISAQGRGYADTPGIWNDAQVAGWKIVTDAVHRAGGLIVCQLWHVGRISHPDLQPGGELPVSASAIKPGGQIYTENGLVPTVVPRALETSEIAGVVRQYKRAAENAKNAGFDGVEIHSANSYLLEQFIRDSTNKRTDQYGGSVENRIRIVMEAAAAVLEVWEPNRVGIRLSPVTTDAGNTPLDSDVMRTYSVLISKLSELKLAYMHVVEGITGGPRTIPADVDLGVLRDLFHGPYIANNGYTSELAQAAVAGGKVNAVAFGVPFIGNPDLVERLRQSAPLQIAPRDTWYGGGAQGYTDWPTLEVVPR